MTPRVQPVLLAAALAGIVLVLSGCHRAAGPAAPLDPPSGGVAGILSDLDRMERFADDALAARQDRALGILTERHLVVSEYGVLSGLGVHRVPRPKIRRPRLVAARETP